MGRIGIETNILEVRMMLSIIAAIFFKVPHYGMSADIDSQVRCKSAA